MGYAAVLALHETTTDAGKRTSKMTSKLLFGLIAAVAVAGGALASAVAPASAAACNTSGMRSIGSNDGREPVVVSAVGDRSAELYWIDFDGKWVRYATIAPNGRHVQQTFRGHVWASVNSYGYCDIVFTVENNVEIIIR